MYTFILDIDVYIYIYIYIYLFIYLSVVDIECHRISPSLPVVQRPLRDDSSAAAPPSQAPPSPATPTHPTPHGATRSFVKVKKSRTTWMGVGAGISRESPGISRTISQALLGWGGRGGRGEGGMGVGWAGPVYN